MKLEFPAKSAFCVLSFEGSNGLSKLTRCLCSSTQSARHEGNITVGVMFGLTHVCHRLLDNTRPRDVGRVRAMPIGSGTEELGRHQGPVGNSDGQSRERTGDESANGKTSLIWRFRILIFILYTPLHAPLVDDSGSSYILNTPSHVADSSYILNVVLIW